ncbi:MAG: glycolate oxidase subunit GlcE [Gammaproteobacteria bacterium]|nr:glycolate oxidase subunit GlcE [Gammaproteobacteria bacterium]
MSREFDNTIELQQAVISAAAQSRPLNLTGGNSKAFYGGEIQGAPLALGSHSGVVNYEPKELVLTARAGTPLQEIEAVLAQQKQMLAFEPPHFGDNATLGGTIACGLSGPRRPYAGSARDFVLGVRIINGKGEILRFGGEVMKNVAGYDVSRLMCGAMGTLGILLDISLKVLPMPQTEITLVQERSPAQAISVVNGFASLPLPITAACYDGLKLYLRLSGEPEAVAAGRNLVGGSTTPEGNRIWFDIREHQHAFFDSGQPLWRLSLPAHTAPIELPGKQLIDWGGAQRWLVSDAPAATIRKAAEGRGGHATLFRNARNRNEVFHPLTGSLNSLHLQLKRAFDPKAIFNPGRLYPDF